MSHSWIRLIFLFPNMALNNVGMYANIFTNDRYLMTCLAMANSIERVVGWFKANSGRSYDDDTVTKAYGPAAVYRGDPCNLVYRALIAPFYNRSPFMYLLESPESHHQRCFMCRMAEWHVDCVSGGLFVRGPRSANDFIAKSRETDFFLTIVSVPTEARHRIFGISEVRLLCLSNMY